MNSQLCGITGIKQAVLQLHVLRADAATQHIACVVAAYCRA